MSSQREKTSGGGGGKSAGDAKSERLAAALRANLKRRKSQARDRADLEREAADETTKTR